MTETDATMQPLEMPAKFLSFIDRPRVCLLFKEMLYDLIIALPRDHLKHIKLFLTHISYSSKDIDRVILLVSPKLKLDIQKLVKVIVKDLTLFVITRRCLIDTYEKTETYVPGCIPPEKMSEVAKMLSLKEQVASSGWLMFDHPCTVREARCLQQDGVLPSVTLALMPTPDPGEPTEDPRTPARTFFQQDFEGLKYVYKATLKEVFIDKDEVDVYKIGTKCFNAVRAAAAGAQGLGQGFHVLGTPGVYRVNIIGPLGSGRRTQSQMLAKEFNLVVLSFHDIYNEAKERKDEIGESLRKYGSNVALRAAIVERRIMQKDCLEHGWVLNGYPENGIDFEMLDKMETPPNRIIFLNCDKALCRERCMSVAVDWCTGKRVRVGVGPRAVPHPEHPEAQLDEELNYYFSEALAELRAAAGMTAKEVSAAGTTEEVNTRLQAAVIAALPYNIDTSPTFFRGVNAN